MLGNAYYIFPETKAFIDKRLVYIFAREEVHVDHVVLFRFWLLINDFFYL